MRTLKIISLVAIIAVVGWNSVYFMKLDEMKASRSQKDFDAKKYAEEFWKKNLTNIGGKRLDLYKILERLRTDRNDTFENYSHALGIGNLRYFLVYGFGTVERVEDDYVIINDSIKIATEFIFGNAVRDASGLIDINEFTNTMDFNNVSAELNKIVREQVIPSFKTNVKPGDSVEFVGAIELNREHLQLNNIEIIPIQLKIR